MKNLLLLISLLSINFVYAQKDFELNFDVGLPLLANKTSEIDNVFVGINVNKYFYKQMFAGIGLEFSSINTKPFTTRFTYDRTTFYPFLNLGYNFVLANNKFEISPQIKIGYSFYSYSLNEFNTEQQSDNGLFSAVGIGAKYRLYNNLFIGVKSFYSIIFNSYKNPAISVPANYMTAQKSYIDNTFINIGFAYQFNLQ
jgi:hypothetical protein